MRHALRETEMGRAVVAVALIAALVGVLAVNTTIMMAIGIAATALVVLVAAADIRRHITAPPSTWPRYSTAVRVEIIDDPEPPSLAAPRQEIPAPTPELPVIEPTAVIIREENSK